MVLQLALLLLPVAAACGWYVGKNDDRHPSIGNSQSLRKDYFKGLNYLINEEPDKAVDVFIKLLEVDSDTVETHLALGSLFRQRGEVDRAIRIHQNLIARPQLEKQYRVQALSALGQDYLRAGVLDRAERLFLELTNMGEENQNSLRYLLHIYQQEKDWLKAINIALKLQSITGQSMFPIIAQYYCELAEQSKEKGYVTQAREYLKKAQDYDRDCVRASLVRGSLEYDVGQYHEAIQSYKYVKNQDPNYLPETIAPLSLCFQKISAENQFIDYLYQCLDKYPRISIILAIAHYLQRKKGDKVAIDFLAEQITRRPSLRGVGYLVELYLLNSFGDTHEKLTILKNFIDKLAADKPIYQCSHCGYSGKTLFWLCPSCHRWSTVKPIQGLEGG